MRAMVSPALPALTVLTASIERLGQSCARAAGAKMIRTAHATAPHHVRNDIDTSLECGRSSIDFVGRAGMMPPIGARTQPAARPLRARRMRRHLTPAGRLRILQMAIPAGLLLFDQSVTGVTDSPPSACTTTPNVGLGGRNE